jgi:hypothetical protein
MVEGWVIWGSEIWKIWNLDTKSVPGVFHKVSPHHRTATAQARMYCTVGSGNLTNFLPQAVEQYCNLLKNGPICKPQIALELYWSVLQHYKRILHVWFKIVKQFGSFLYTTYLLVLPTFVEIIACILLGILEMSIWSCTRDTWSHIPCTVCLISSLFLFLDLMPTRRIPTMWAHSLVFNVWMYIMIWIWTWNCI